MTKFVFIPTHSELLRIPSTILMFAVAEGNYSKIFLKYGENRLVSYQLGQLDALIKDQLGEDESPFIRVGRGLIANMDYIYVINPFEQQLILSDWCGKFYNFNVSKNALSAIKLLLETIER